MTASDTLATVQGAYFAATGLWPLLHMRSFEAVTGPKVEDWLVKTVGVLVGAIGTTLLLAGAERRTSPPVTTLAAASAAGLAVIDVLYVAKKRIAPIYLADAVLELGLVAGWLLATRAPRARRLPDV